MAEWTEEILSEIADRYIKGETVYQIAAQMSLTTEGVWSALQTVYEQLKKSVPFRFNEAAIIQLSKIDKAENEAWRSWELSKRPKQRKSSKATKRGGVNIQEEGNAADIDKMEQQINTEEREGSAVYLNLVLSCVKIRMDLLNLK